VNAKVRGLRARLKKAISGSCENDSRPPEDILASLDEPFRSRLLSMYRGEPQQGADGQSHAMNDPAKISPWQGMWIYNLCLSAKPAATLEIGMAYGYSTIFFLAAGAKIGGLRHTAIDPFQLSLKTGMGG
jgi:predicted O-methyltransferase YrrM